MTKGNYFFTAACIVTCVIMSLIICLYGVSSTSSQIRQITVVLDAGHGGIDGGVSGKNTNIKESEINLAIVRELEGIFERSGIKCVLTRKTDAGLYGVLSSGFKMRDMQKRREIIEKAKPLAVISVHQNYLANGSQHGSFVFYRHGDENAKALALSVNKMLLKASDSPSERMPVAGDYYLLNCTPYPSIIAECGFLSDSEDEEKLGTKQYRQALAQAIYSGVIAYIAEQVSA